MNSKISLLLTLISFLSFSQDYNVGMQISRNDLELNSYLKDSTANALVIYDYGNSFVDEDTFWLRVQIEQKIKILKPEGVDRGEFEIKLYKGKSSEEKIKDIKGSTYNLENGKIVRTKLKPSAIFEEENEDYKLVKFAMPRVKEGSVITISYETQSRFMTKYQPWYFQGADPVMYSEYNTSIPGNYEYNIKLVGPLKLDVNDQKLEKMCIRLRGDTGADCTVSKYVMKDIPAYKSEKYTTTSLNYMSRIEYELSVIRRFDGGIDKITKTWKDVDKELKTDRDFGRQVSRRSLAKNVLPSEITSISNDLDKAKAIYNFILDNYKWNNKSERYDVSVKDLLDEKVGSVFEINLLLENLLSNEDIEVYPILISTRDNGLPTKIYPVLTDFNYVIVKAVIDGQNYFLDATDPYLTFGELPFRCLNQYGRLIDFDNVSYWEDIKVDDYSLSQHRAKIKFSNNSFTGTIDSKSKGYHALSLKQSYHENSTAFKEKRVNEYQNVIINNHEIIDFDKKDIEFNEVLDISLEPEYIGNKIYLNPFIFKFFDENPFKLQERTYPIDFGYKNAYNYSMQLDLPQNIKVLELPESVNYALPNRTGSFIFNPVVEGNQLIVYFKVKFNNSIYEPQYYKYLKAFMSKVVEAQNNSVIVLEKS